MGARLARVTRLLLGARPRALPLLLLPAGLSLVIDACLRARALAGYALQGEAIYASSLLVSAGFWGLPVWSAGRLAALARGGSGVARAALAGLVALWILPAATFCYGGQILYYRVFHAYMGRDTLRLGIALRGTVGDWFGSWGGPWLMAAMLASGVSVTLALVRTARAAAAPARGPVPLLAVATFVGALACFWTDNVDSRFLQAATPDTCFVHGVVHAARTALTGQWQRRQGVSLRTPAPLPPLARSPGPPLDVVLVITESVRSDALCSDPPPACRGAFLDAVGAERVPLGKLTSQTPNTFSASLLLWSGVAPTADFRQAHSAPLLWELARAVGYRTAYVSAQNPRYEDFGAFTQSAGIDVLETAVDLGGMEQEQLGAPDERAVDGALRFLGSDPASPPALLVVHLSNTHAPYRIDPGLAPYEPQSADPLGDVRAFHNRYRDAVLLQERTVSTLISGLRARPRWDRTVVVFVSDHGEQFREHGGLYHNHSLFEEEVRVPGWLLAGPGVLDDGQRAALATYSGHRTYTQDVHETVVDLLGLEDARASLPLAELVTGRSLLRPRGAEPIVLMATSTAVWEPDDARFGVMSGERALFGGPTGLWQCFDLLRDPGERVPGPASACGELLPAARRAFGAQADPR